MNIISALVSRLVLTNKRFVSVLKINICLVLTMVSLSCAEQVATQIIDNKESFCRYALNTFIKNDALQYSHLLREEKDIDWLKEYLTSYTPKSSKEKQVFEELKKDLPDFKAKMIDILDDDRIVLMKEFSRIHNAGVRVGLAWHRVSVVKCELVQVRADFGVPLVLINMYIKHAGNTFLITNEAFHLGNRGFRAKATPHWRGKVEG